MKTVKAYKMDGSYNVYEVPPISVLIAHSKDTMGRQYDPVERKMVEGGLPYVLKVAK